MCTQNTKRKSVNSPHFVLCVVNDGNASFSKKQEV